LGLIEQTLKGHTTGVNSVSFSPDGQRIVSTSGDGIKVWSLETGKVETNYNEN
jgi:WD40 repeat protein